jgi:hypothetical protein
MAGCSADAAEMTRVQRMAAVCPPLMQIQRMEGSEPLKMQKTRAIRIAKSAKKMQRKYKGI